MFSVVLLFFFAVFVADNFHHLLANSSVCIPSEKPLNLTLKLKKNKNI